MKGKLPEHLAAVRLHPTVKKGQRPVNTTRANRVDITKVREIFLRILSSDARYALLMDFFHQNLLPAMKTANASAAARPRVCARHAA